MKRVIKERGEWKQRNGKVIYGIELYREKCLNPSCKKGQDGITFYYPTDYITSECPECKQPLNGGRLFESEYSRTNYHLT